MFFLLLTWLWGSDLQKIAIVDFDSSVLAKDPKTPTSEDPESLLLTKALMDSLELELQVEYDIVERRKLETVKNEHRVGEGFRVDQIGQTKSWELIKADYLLTGTITDFVKRKTEFKSDHYQIKTQTVTYLLEISFKMIESRTGKVVVVGQASARTDTRQLRSLGREDGYQGYLCQDLAKKVRMQIVKDMRARQE